jgi:hypothetical protein
MAIAVPHFYEYIIIYTGWVLTILTLVIEVVAFLHCLLQRADAFPAIGTLSKGLWLALIGGSTLFVLLGFGAQLGLLSGLLSLVPIVVALVYLLDVRPALRDVVDGHGPW